MLLSNISFPLFSYTQRGKGACRLDSVSATMHRSMLILTVTSIVSQLLAFVYRILLSRLVGAQVLGLYQLVMPVYFVLMSLTAVGLTVAVSNLSARYHALGNHRAVAQLLRRCRSAFFLLFVPPAVLMALFSDAVSVSLLGDARTRLGLLLLLPCIFFTGIENLHKHYFYGIGNVRPPAAVELAEQLIRAGAVLSLLLLFLPQNPERTLGLIVTGMVLCAIFSAATLLLLCRRHMGSPRALPGPGEPSAVLNRRICAIAVPIGATSLLGNLMASANSALIPQRLVAGGMEISAAMSAFGVLFGMTMPLLFLPSAFIGALSLVLAPKLAESAALKRGAEIRRRIHTALLATSAIMLPAMALLIVLGAPIGVFLFHEPAVGGFLAPLSAGVLLSCYQAVLATSLNGVGLSKTAAHHALLCGAVQLGFTFFAVGLPGVGLRGYVAGFVTSEALGALLDWLSVQKATGLRLQLFSWFAAPALSALLTGLSVRLLFRILSDAGLSPVLGAAACLFFGGALYAFALQAQGVPLLSLFRPKTERRRP